MILVGSSEVEVFWLNEENSVHEEYVGHRARLRQDWENVEQRIYLGQLFCVERTSEGERRHKRQTIWGD